MPTQYSDMCVQIRAKKRWTQKQLGRKLGCTRSMISAIELKNRLPGSTLAIRLEEEYNRIVRGVNQLKMIGL